MATLKSYSKDTKGDADPFDFAHLSSLLTQQTDCIVPGLLYSAPVKHVGACSDTHVFEADLSCLVGQPGWLNADGIVRTFEGWRARGPWKSLPWPMALTYAADTCYRVEMLNTKSEGAKNFALTSSLDFSKLDKLVAPVAHPPPKPVPDLEGIGGAILETKSTPTMTTEKVYLVNAARCTTTLPSSEWNVDCMSKLVATGTAGTVVIRESGPGEYSSMFPIVPGVHNNGRDPLMYSPDMVAGSTRTPCRPTHAMNAWLSRMAPLHPDMLQIIKAKYKNGDFIAIDAPVAWNQKPGDNGYTVESILIGGLVRWICLTFRGHFEAAMATEEKKSTLYKPSELAKSPPESDNIALPTYYAPGFPGANDTHKGKPNEWIAPRLVVQTLANGVIRFVAPYDAFIAIYRGMEALAPTSQMTSKSGVQVMFKSLDDSIMIPTDARMSAVVAISVVKWSDDPEGKNVRSHLVRWSLPSSEASAFVNGTKEKEAAVSPSPDAFSTGTVDGRVKVRPPNFAHLSA
jgi:hypothetical protein